MFIPSHHCSYRSDDSDDELDDQMIGNILIVTQTPPSSRKHPGGDRTGDYTPRAKISADLAMVINDGLFYYEQEELAEQDVKVRNREVP